MPPWFIHHFHCIYIYICCCVEVEKYYTILQVKCKISELFRAFTTFPYVAFADGYYIYIETSEPRQKGDKARLISPQLSGSAKCITFWFLMYGPNVADLNIYSRTGPSQLNKVFTRSGTHGTRWIQAQVDMTSKVPFQVTFCTYTFSLSNIEAK